MATGWPFGLGNMNIRLRMGGDGLQLQGVAAEPLPLHMPSTSFSSISSHSNLDTESTASFFQDNSVSLGRLIGIRPVVMNRGSLYFSNTINFPQHQNVGSVTRKKSELDHDVCHGGREAEMSRRMCAPLLGVLEKMSRKSYSKGVKFDNKW